MSTNLNLEAQLKGIKDKETKSEFVVTEGRKVKTMNLEELICSLERKEIDIPEYQRDLLKTEPKDVWPYIVTLLKGESFTGMVLSERDGKLNLVEGQQRCKGIYELLKNGKKFSKLPYPYIWFNGKTMMDILIEYPYILRKVDLDFTLYDDLSYEEEKSIYDRLNENQTQQNFDERLRSICIQNLRYQLGMKLANNKEMREILPYDYAKNHRCNRTTQFGYLMSVMESGKMKMTSVNKTAKDFYMNPSEFNVEQFRVRMNLVKYFVDAARNSKGKMNKTYLNVLFLAFAKYSNEELERVIKTSGLSQSLNSVIKKVMNDVREDNSFKDAVNSRVKMEEFASRLQDRMDDIIRPDGPEVMA